MFLLIDYLLVLVFALQEVVELRSGVLQGLPVTDAAVKWITLDRDALLNAKQAQLREVLRLGARILRDLLEVLLLQIQALVFAGGALKARIAAALVALAAG